VTANPEPAGGLDELLPRIAAGDTDAFGEWMRGAEPRIRASLRSFAARVDVEAIVQEALLRVWLAARRFVDDGRGNGLLRLAIRIARNLTISELRRRRLGAPEIDLAGPTGIVGEPGYADPEPPSDPLLRQRIVDCIGRLPRQPGRALAVRLESAGLQPDTVLAERLGMTLNTFLQNFTRARKLVAKCLERYGVDLALELA
jgi:RNA polymerase sigma-70 factor (ECF subfamily)